MLRSVYICFCLMLSTVLCAQNGAYLKYVVYDFDGLDHGQTDLPDGDYSNGDLTYSISDNPLSSSDVLGDRVLKLDLNWSVGSGEFGKEMARFLELNAGADKLNFYFFNPPANSANAQLKVTITEDDDNDNQYNFLKDDEWIYSLTIPRDTGWQLFSLPLNSFVDGNAGGNGVFDARYTKPGGMLFSVGFVFTHADMSATSQYFLDMIAFSESDLPRGNTILDLPPRDSAYICMLGALTSKETPDSTPEAIQSLLPAGKRLSYVNWFLDYSKSGTVANQIPGDEVLKLLSNGYRPVITWEAMYGGYARLDSVQPRLDKILNGTFDSYIDAFADKAKSFDDTVIIRIFHEFEGNWYPWSLTENGQDPAVYISAYRHVVDRFRARGASKVLWMWCVNAEPEPYVVYNWIVSAYPGDNYVDIVATDIYNHPNLGVPPWKSFRYTMAESYYYLTRYFPQKPFYVCEVACRERYPGEVTDSQSKADWVCRMGNDLQTYFNQTKAIIFFSEVKEHDWRINSSPQALQAFTSCIWDNRFFGQPFIIITPGGHTKAFALYPNPFTNQFSIGVEGASPNDLFNIRILDMAGRPVYQTSNLLSGETIVPERELASGLYVLELSNNSYKKLFKIVKASE